MEFGARVVKPRRCSLRCCPANRRDRCDWPEAIERLASVTEVLQFRDYRCPESWIAACRDAPPPRPAEGGMTILARRTDVTRQGVPAVTVCRGSLGAVPETSRERLRFDRRPKGDNHEQGNSNGGRGRRRMRG